MGSDADPEIQLLVLRALLEAARALHIEHGVPLDEIYLHIEDLLFRFENKLLGDYNRARWPRYKTQTQRKRQAGGRGQTLL